MNPADLVLVILRLWMGAVMIAHGVNHGRNLDGTASWFSKIGFRQARLQAQLSAVGEVVIGLGLAVGLLTPFAAAGLVAVMFTAFWTVHRFAGFFVFHRPDEGWEYVATLAVAALAVATLGPGTMSLDAAFGTVIDGWAGFGIALLGVVAAAGQLALFWRTPANDE